MENNGMQEHMHADGSKCNCNSWGGMHGRHGHWKYMLVKILVAIFIFWAGAQFGELKAMLHGAYGNYGGVYNTRGAMMGGTWSY